MKFRLGRRARVATTVGAVAVASLLATSSPASALPGAGYIRYGETGDRALCVQLGIDSMDNSTIYTYPDGQFGPSTLKALKAFQSYWHLDPDGVVGPATGTKLMEMIYLDSKRAGRADSDNTWCYRVLPTYS
ncbi:peptidoglycan-binding domain-containing protein [Kitasatospora sp. NPDC047058]|uniref:peptidoglycan-binding domain-containing protein n=1 Tax=Kitasatospora sp. NPDC047058 TaxID=3155620 RepID=UPI0033E6B65D